jgi:predicted dehydrogenase
MNPVRLGIIGLGNIGKHHAAYLLEGKVPRCRLAAVCSPSPAKLESYRNHGLKIFGRGETLIQSGEVDAVLVATPHYQAGLHVMVEKPISAHKADAERLIAAARRHPRLKFAGMFQLRVEPRYEKIRGLIQNGELGAIVRVNWIITDWYRTEAYYASSGWRATWSGEGGGVLLNQCLHNLDVLAWLLGRPARVRGFCQLGRFHNIEVEDNVTAYLEYPGRATGVFITSTGEAPGANRFEIAGTLGQVVLENNRLTFTRNAADMIAFSQTSKVGFTKPEASQREIPFEDALGPHAQLMRNFTDAILDGTPLLVPGEEGLLSVELANAMLYSSLLGQTVDLPLDGAAFERKLQELAANSKFEKKVVEIGAEDFARSFKR